MNRRIHKIVRFKLEVVKQEMARVNVDILGIRELKWTGMGELINSFSCSSENLLLVIHMSEKKEKKFPSEFFWLV